MASSLSRPILAAAAAGAWLPLVAEAGLVVETGHRGVMVRAACVERRCPSSPLRQRYRVQVHQAAVAPSLDAGPVERRKESDAERIVVLELGADRHVLFTRFIVTWAPDGAAANRLRIHDDSGGICPSRCPPPPGPPRRWRGRGWRRGGPGRGGRRPSGPPPPGPRPSRSCRRPARGGAGRGR